MSETLSFSASHQPEATTDFPYDEASAHIFGGHKTETEKQDAQREGIQLLYTFLRWIHQSGMEDRDGIATRVIVLFWILLPEFESKTMTEVAVSHGCTKQNIGKWVADFKKTFPRVKNKHMRK